MIILIYIHTAYTFIVTLYHLRFYIIAFVLMFLNFITMSHVRVYLIEIWSNNGHPHSSLLICRANLLPQNEISILKNFEKLALVDGNTIGLVVTRYNRVDLF